MQNLYSLHRVIFCTFWHFSAVFGKISKNGNCKNIQYVEKFLDLHHNILYFSLDGANYIWYT